MKDKTKIAIIVALFFWLAFPEPVYAYIDPASTTYIIQIVSALVITLSVTIGIFFSKLRLSLVNLRVRITELLIRIFSTKKDNIPSNKKSSKTINIYIEPNVESLSKISKKDYLWQDNRSFKQRLPLNLLVSFAFAFTFVFFGIYELFITNTDSFMFSLKNLLGTLFLATVVSTVCLFVFFSLLKGRILDWFISLFFGLLFAGYIQGNFLNKSLGELTGDRLNWENLRIDLIINLLIWCIFLSIPFIIHFLNKKSWATIIKAVCCLLVVIQTISIFSFYDKFKEKTLATNFQLSTQGINEVAQKDNIIVIVLDRLDNRFIEKILSEKPDYFQPLDGFIRFTNNMSLYSQTFPSVATMFNGENYYYEQPKSTYLKNAWTTSPVISALQENDYKINLYMESGFTYDKAFDLKGIAENVIEKDVKLEQVQSLKRFLILSAFRYAPLSFKPFFWTSTDQFNKLIISEEESEVYVTDDIKYYNDLKDQKLKTNSDNKLFTYLHLNGSHSPYLMNEFAAPVSSEQSNSIIQTKGSFHIVYEYLKQLKELGLYKDSTIIIMGDHGARKDDYHPLDRAIVTGLFIKPAGKADTPLQLNRAPVSADNFRPFIIEASGLPHADFGKTYFEIDENTSTTRYYYYRLKKDKNQPQRLLTYEINGDANDFSNWSLIEDKVIVN